MLAGPNVTMVTMRRAVAHTVTALRAASEVDVDRTEEDRRFFGTLREELQPVADRLRATDVALQTHDADVGLLLNVRVQLGDAVLDRGIRHGNALTKIGLKGKGGLDAGHVFGKVDTLTMAPIRAEPTRVLDAMARMDELAEFPGRDELKTDLIGRAQSQERFLLERDQGNTVRNRLDSEALKAIADASSALFRAKGLLDSRFPRQRTYVAEFFLDTSPRRRPREDAGAPEEVAAAPGDASRDPAPVG